jgi:quinol monooxygenase YgiN
VATALAHIQVRAGMESRFERVAAELHRLTHEREPGVRRYEYFRGAEPATYYCLLSFDDYHGFLAHQSSDHHEDASDELRAVTECIRLEWLDPLPDASSLVPTKPQPLPPGAAAATARVHERFADIGETWWLDLR